MSKLVDDALAKVSELGTVGAMKWLEEQVVAKEELQIQRMLDTINELKERERDTYADLAMRRKKEIGEVWYWQHEGGNYIESITCPIVIPASVFRSLVSKEVE